jgi:hypothetical protein
MTRYTPSRTYRYLGLAALALAVLCAWMGTRWMSAWIPATLFTITATVTLVLSWRPQIEVHESHLAIGSRVIPWAEIRRLDRTGWVSPLVVNVTLADNRRIQLVYPGELESSNTLLRQLRRMSREALIDGIPYRQFWGEALPSAADRKALPSPKYQVVSADEEAEIEKMFQRLKAVGHLDPKNTPAKNTPEDK